MANFRQLVEWINSETGFHIHENNDKTFKTSKFRLVTGSLVKVKLKQILKHNNVLIISAEACVYV